MRANAISPGVIDTEFTRRLSENADYTACRVALTPLRRFGTPDDVAGAVVYLVIDGGPLQTLGETIVTLSQLERTGLRHEDNAFTQRSCSHQTLLDWCEQHFTDTGPGFVADAVSLQDIMLACCCQLLDRRALRIHWQTPQRPRVYALVKSLAQRASFQQEPVLWWEPGIDYAVPGEHAWALAKTNDGGASLAQWRASRG